MSYCGAILTRHRRECQEHLQEAWGDVHFKGGQTLKNILVSPKDKDNITSKSSVIYSYTCGEIDCDEEYIGESGRTFGERYKEHLKAPSPIFLHQNSSGLETTLNNFKIL